MTETGLRTVLNYLFQVLEMSQDIEVNQILGNAINRLESEIEHKENNQNLDNLLKRVESLEDIISNTTRNLNDL